nr:molybdopterin-dependent oxidoreductase [Pseudomonadota bacterium]
PSQLADALGKVDVGDAAHVALLVGGVAENGPHAAEIRLAAAAFAARTGARVCRIPQGANALGLSSYGVLPATRDAQAMLRAPRSAYVIHGIEPGLDFADQHLALKALGEAQVVSFSQFACSSTRAVADVILPIAALPEIDATLTNLDGFIQQCSAAGKAPGEARSGWRVLRALADVMSLPGFEFTELIGLRASMTVKDMQPSKGLAPAMSGGGLEVVVSQAIYRVDGVVRRAQALQAHPLNVGPRAVLNPADAGLAGICDAAMGKFATGVGSAVLQVVLDDGVAPGCVWIESGYGATAPLAASGHAEISQS